MLLPFILVEYTKLVIIINSYIIFLILTKKLNFIFIYYNNIDIIFDVSNSLK